MRIKRGLNYNSYQESCNYFVFCLVGEEDDDEEDDNDNDILMRDLKFLFALDDVLALDS